MLHSHHGNLRRSYHEAGLLRHGPLQLVNRDLGTNAIRGSVLGLILCRYSFRMSKNDLQQDDRVDHRSNSDRWYQHRLGAESGNQPGHGLNLGNGNIASLHFSVSVWSAG